MISGADFFNYDILLTMNELLRGIDEIISQPELAKALKGPKKLRIKFGVDPSSADIHLGHAVVLRKLRQFQDMGHTVIFLIGDYTAKIGDPSGKKKTRPVLTEKEITQNAQTYLDQVGKILDIKKVEIRRNSEWLDKLSFADLLDLTGKFTVAQIIERDDFKSRLTNGIDVGLHEILYPVMQAYDSVMLMADVEFGGTDQRFNMLAGRALQKKLDQRPQQVVMAKILVGTDGVQKMSKSLGNYISLTDLSHDMYGKIMSIPDELMASYYELCTEVELGAIDEMIKNIAAGANPRDSKASLARDIVAIYHGESAAVEAEDHFNKLFRDKTGPDKKDIEIFFINQEQTIVDFLAESTDKSKSQVRRLIDQSGIKLNQQIVADANQKIGPGDLLQVGKRLFIELRKKD
jgi:tyrosyl-tRNA synthetase